MAASCGDISGDFCFLGVVVMSLSEVLSEEFCSSLNGVEDFYDKKQPIESNLNDLAHFHTEYFLLFWQTMLMRI